LLVPSTWEEPFARVAAEAMINGIPAIVSERGGLPETVGGDFASGGAGLVRALPLGFTKFTTALPNDNDVKPWFDAVCQLWDDDEFYGRISERARQFAAENYAEPVLRSKYLEYFTTLPRVSQSLLERELAGNQIA
jgi:glycosyltransferase involved in cell wall biosynthesis